MKRIYFICLASLVAILLLIVGYYLNSIIENIWVKLIFAKLLITLGYNLLSFISGELSKDWKEESKLRSNRKNNFIITAIVFLGFIISITGIYLPKVLPEHLSFFSIVFISIGIFVLGTIFSIWYKKRRKKVFYNRFRRNWKASKLKKKRMHKLTLAGNVELSTGI